MNNEIAVLIAAGKGERMRPLTLTTPKPLVKVHGTPMIETVIDGLNQRGVKAIYIVIGYLGDCFKYLEKKYKNVKLVWNKEYSVKNNISSIYVVRDIMKNKNCFICESDIYIVDPMIFRVEFKNSCYYGKMLEGESNDWVFDLNSHGRVIRIGKNGNNSYNMCGICYLYSSDVEIILKSIDEVYQQPGHEQLFWDEIVNKEIKNIYMTINPVDRSKIFEIDTILELKNIDSSYSDI